MDNGVDLALLAGCGLLLVAVLAGLYFKEVSLGPTGGPPHSLVLACDSAAGNNGRTTPRCDRAEAGEACQGRNHHSRTTNQNSAAERR